MHRRNEVPIQPIVRVTMPWRRARGVARAFAAVALLASCHHDVTVLAPDLAQAQLYRLQLVNNQTPPFLVELLPFGGTRWLVDAQLVPVDLGRGSDPRVFEDRSGNGQSGGTARDSSAVSGRVADVRVFHERNGAGTLLSVNRDSVVVNVIRHGDTLFVQRESINPTLAYTDTATFFEQSLVMRVRRWTHSPSAPRLAQSGTITYGVTVVDVTRQRSN